MESLEKNLQLELEELQSQIQGLSQSPLYFPLLSKVGAGEDLMIAYESLNRISRKMEGKKLGPARELSSCYETFKALGSMCYWREETFRSLFLTNENHTMTRGAQLTYQRELRKVLTAVGLMEKPCVKSTT